MNVPPVFLAALDFREDDCNPARAIGQGDRWNQKSVNVPRGLGPWGSKLDADKFYVHYDHLDNPPAPYDLVVSAFEGLMWNGWGYDNNGILSPYLVGGTNHQQRGKYTRDRFLDRSVMDQQVGILPIMLEAIRRRPDLAFGGQIPSAGAAVPSEPPTPPATVKFATHDAQWVQNSLNLLGVVPPEVAPLAVDGNYGRNTARAVRAFQTKFSDDYDLDVDGIVGDETTAAIDAELAKLAPAAERPKIDAAKIVTAMGKLKYEVRVGADAFNIVYVEGVDPDGQPNANRGNAFDACRYLIQVLEDGTAKIVGAWEATTHAGAYYEHHKLNPGGAFHIALGQQTAWRLGIYSHGNYEALLQVSPLFGTRDAAEDFQRRGATIHELVGAHHHWGYDYPKGDVKNSAAGCQVGRTKDGHLEFIRLLKTDRSFKADRSVLWTSTVMTVEQVLAA
jgi:lysozyme family protein